MTKCIKCGSYAFNLYKEHIDQSGFCDVHYWQGRAHRAEALAQPVQEPIHQWRQQHSPFWYDGYPDNNDGGGPYETRTLYTTPPAKQPTTVPLTDEQIVDTFCKAPHQTQYVAWFAAGVRYAEAHHGITEKGQP